jgi:hypothetical protein
MEVQNERLDRQVMILFYFISLFRIKTLFPLLTRTRFAFYLFLFFTRIGFTIVTRNMFTFIYFVMFSFLEIGLLLLLGLRLFSLQVFLFYK